MPLTDSSIRALKPGSSRTRHSDGLGLFLEVNPTGSKLFRISYRFAGKQTQLKLGEYPRTTLKEARLRRDRVRLALEEGVDPRSLEFVADPIERRAQALRDAGAEAECWRKHTNAYREFRERQGMHPSTAAKLHRQLDVTIEKLGDLIVDEIEAKDILDLVRPYEDAGKVETAHELRSRCSQIFDFAAANGVRNFNPARVVTGAMIKRRRGRFPGLIEPKAVGVLMRDIRGYRAHQPQVRIGLLLSAYLFPRSAMIRGMRWDEINWEDSLWEIPSDRMKGSNGDSDCDHLVPLPRQALALLGEISSWTRNHPLVLPSPYDGTRPLSDMTFNKALRSLGYDTRTEHCHHGFRITASTNLNELGFNRDWIETSLAHMDKNLVRGTYNKAQYLTGRREMMQAYADWLDEREATRD